MPWGLLHRRGAQACRQLSWSMGWDVLVLFSTGSALPG